MIDNTYVYKSPFRAIETTDAMLQADAYKKFERCDWHICKDPSSCDGILLITKLDDFFSLPQRPF